MPGRFVRKTWEYGPTIYAPARYRRACHYDAFVPDELASLDFHLNAEQAGLLSEAEHAIRDLNEQGGASLVPLARLLLRSEAIASSKIEGMQVGVSQLARAEAKSKSGMKVGRESIEILANIDAMSVAVSDASTVDIFTEKELLRIHNRLLKASHNNHIAGRWRADQNWIGGNDHNPCGADFVPPPPTELERLLADLFSAINADTWSPLVQAALVHAQFETIHPFEDGNGRIGRALVQVLLRRRGVAPWFIPPISIVFAGARDRYIEGLTKFRGNDIVPWIEEFALAMLAAARKGQTYLTEVRELQEQWRAQLQHATRPPRADAAAWAIIDQLPAHPVISAPMIESIISRAKSRVYEAIEQLEEARILLPISSGKRHRWWEAVGIIDTIERLESGAALTSD